MNELLNELLTLIDQNVIRLQPYTLDDLERPAIQARIDDWTRRARLPSIEDMKALAVFLGPCLGCVEKEKRLTEAVALIRRGVRMLNRTGWEKGETDDEWRIKARSFLAQHDMETEYLKSQAQPGSNPPPST